MAKIPFPSQTLSRNPFNLGLTPCHTPSSLQGLSWTDITLSQLGCDPGQVVSGVALTHHAHWPLRDFNLILGREFSS